MRRGLLDSLLDLLALSITRKGLDSLLFFDASPLELEWIADLLQPAWQQWIAAAVSRAYLSPFHTEEDLWGTGPGIFPGMSTDGLLFPGDNGRRIMILPDLSEAGPVVSRALIQCLGGGESIHLERHGRQEQQAPKLIWIAGCPSGSVGKVSKHVLDRFALRPPRLTFDARDRESRLKRRLRFEEERGPGSTEQFGPMKRLHEGMRRRVQFLKGVPSPKLESLDVSLVTLAQMPSDQRTGVRRYLTLARLSTGLARLAHKDPVPRAMDLMQWQREPKDDIEEDRPFEGEDFKHDRPGIEPHAPTIHSTDPGPETLASASTMDPRVKPIASGSAPTDDEIFEAVLVDPFPEDQALGELESASLRFEASRSSLSRRERGAVIGSEPVPGSASLDDLALIPTLMAALPFQKLRRAGNAIGGRLILTRDDLRRRRRTPQARRLLLLLADATALAGDDRLDPWMPTIRQAYVDRSAVCVVLVGGRDAPHELRAERINARNVLVPEVEATLSRPAGVATPLAHGFHLALEALRKACNRDGIETVHLVVLSDGRGNIPLDSGFSGKLSGPVGSQGIWDSLKIAEKIAAMPQVEARVLDPQPAYGSHLVGELADALGATVTPILTGAPPQ